MSLTIRRLPEEAPNLLRPPTTVTPSQNGDVVLEATSNTVLTMKLKGTDGVVRNFDVGGGASSIGTEYDIRAVTTTGGALLRLTSSYSVLDDVKFAGTANEITVAYTNDNEMTFSLPNDVIIGNDLTVTGNLDVQGTTTTINSTTLQVDDITVELGTVATPTDATANGGGIVLKGATDKLITWSNTNDAWTFNQNVYPSADSSWNLGSAAIRWQNIYADAADITSITGALTGNADTATALETARNISGVSFDGSQNITLVTDNVQESGTPTNIYFTDARARAAVSVTDSGGDGSLAYDSGTGVITYTGPSATEVRSHLSAGTGVGFSGGVISIGQAVGTSDSVEFAGITGPLTGNADTATALQTARTINGVSFNGTANITLDLDDIAEASVTPTNLFYTNERVDDRVSVLLQGGTGITKSYNDGADSLTLSVDFSEFDTDDVNEGTTNIYFTDARARAAVSAVDSGGDGSFAYDSSTGAFTYTGPSAAEVRAHVSVSDVGGDGSLAYDSGTGIFTFTGSSPAETRVHFSGGTGVTYDNVAGEFSIGQDVATNASVNFAAGTFSGADTRALILNNTDNTGTVNSAGQIAFRHTGIDFTNNSIVADGNDLGHIEFRNNGGSTVGQFGWRKRGVAASKLSFEVDTDNSGTPNFEVNDNYISFASTNINVTGTLEVNAQTSGVTYADNGANVGPDFILQRDTTSVANNDLIGRLLFNSQDASYSNDVSYAGILAEAELVSAGSERGRLFLQCSDGGALVNTMTLKGKLVGLGIDEPAGQFHVKGNDTTDQIIIENETNSSTTAPDLVLYKSGTIGVGHQPGRIDFRGRNGLNNANVTYSSIISEVEGTSNLSEGGAIKFFTTQSGTLTEAARINSAGNFKLQAEKGIDFSNQTALGGATYEILDHYEEGSYAATPYFANTNRAGMSTNSTGYYTKVGRMVHVHAKMIVNIIDNTLIGGELRFPLPFEPAISCGDNAIMRVIMENDAGHFLNTGQTQFLDDSRDMIVSHKGSQDQWVVLQGMNADYQRGSIVTSSNCAIGLGTIFLDFTYRASS